jgi:uncharacterized membrane protein (UPF0127 family)
MEQLIVSLRGHRFLDRCDHANNFFLRMRGLIGRSELLSGEGILIKPCNSVHTCFMRFAIDVLFLDGKKSVIHIEHSMLPWRFSRIVFGAKSVLELRAGTAKAIGVVHGDVLAIEANVNGKSSDYIS